MNFIKKSIQLVLFFYCYFTFSQHAAFYQFTEEDGLITNEFYDMIKDSKGYLWFASNDGLYKYDGDKFKLYDSTIKRGFAVFGLLEDENGRIWCNNMSGQIFYVENNSLKLFIDLNELIKTNAFLEFKIFKQKMYVSASNNLIEVDIKTRKTRYVENVSKDKETKTKGVKIVNNSLWYIEYTNTKNYLIKFSKKNKEIDSAQNVTDIFKTKNHLFVNTDYILRTDLLYWNFKNQGFQSLINPKKIRKTRTVYIYEDSKSFLWLCTNKGVLQFKIEEGKMIELNTFFPDKFVTRVIEDDNGNYWFSTLNNGVFIIPNLGITYYNKENSLIEENKVTSLANDGINTVFYNKGKKT